MTVKIDGTNTVANPAFTGADTDTGLQCGTNELKLVTGGTSRIEVNAANAAVVTIPQNGNQLLLKQTDTDSGYLLGCNNTNGDLTFSRRSVGSNIEEFRMLAGGGLTFNGDTATANALDDYEEGTWTAGLEAVTSASGSITFTSNTGTYIKIGKMCFISIFLKWSASTLGGSNLKLTGLPFPSQSTDGRRGGFQITYRSNALTGLSNVHDLTLRTETGVTYARFQYGNGDGNAVTELSGGDIKNANATMMITGCYET